MIGDNIEIRQEYLDISKIIIDHLTVEYFKGDQIICIAIGGESGCGKSTLSAALQKCFDNKNINSLIIQQDDYFLLPPKTNHKNREKNINNVGIEEVQLNLLDEHIKNIKNQSSKIIEKPLVNYEKDEISREFLKVENLNVLIVEGTYTMLLKMIDKKIFMTRNYSETKHYRIARGRDINSPFNEEVVKIEHRIIKEHKNLADFIIDNNMSLISASPSSRG